MSSLCSNFQSLGTNNGSATQTRLARRPTALELTGEVRPGLLSEVFAVLADLGCDVGEAHVWTHNGRAACVISFSSGDVDFGRIEALLRHVLRGGARVAATSSAGVAVHPERRLHQLMFVDRDYESAAPASADGAAEVTVQEWWERGYSVVNVDCADRPKLLFDIVCTLTDMDYVVFHATIDSRSSRAHQVTLQFNLAKLLICLLTVCPNWQVTNLQSAKLQDFQITHVELVMFYHIH